MIRVAFVVHRQWGYDIFKQILQYQSLRQDFSIDALIFSENHECKRQNTLEKGIATYVINPNNTTRLYTILKKHTIDLVFLYSWSFLVKEPTLSEFTCLCLHPSPLPRYRGGTPIQHQLIDGKEKSRVTIFRMSQLIDGGPILTSAPISLLGTIHDIFSRMVDVGTILTQDILDDAANKKLSWKVQKNLSKYPARKRRTPRESEIDFQNIQHMSFKKFHNMVRGLLPPYPRVTILLGKKKLFVNKAIYYTDLPKNSPLFQNPKNYSVKKNVFMKLRDGFAKLIVSVK